MSALLVAAMTLVGVPAAQAGHVQGDRLAGDNRYETAAAIADEVAPAGAEEVFLARGDRFPDALVASFAVGHTGGPVLLTEPRRVPESTLEALDRLDASEVVLLGGRATIQPRVAERLRGAGYRVDRVDGAAPSEVAAALARRYADEGIGSVHGKRTALLASGASFEDALLAAPLASGAHFPLLLTGRTRYPSEVAEALADLEVEQVFIVGDTTAVSHSVHQALERDGYTVDRLGDTEDHGTAAIVGQFAIYHLRWSLEEVLLVDTRRFADGLAAGSLAGLSEGVVVLTDPPAADFAETWLGELCPRIGGVTVVGDSEAVPIQWHDRALQAADACPHGIVPRPSTGVAPTPDADGDDTPNASGVNSRGTLGEDAGDEDADRDEGPRWDPRLRWFG